MILIPQFECPNKHPHSFHMEIHVRETPLTLNLITPLVLLLWQELNGSIGLSHLDFLIFMQQKIFLETIWWKILTIGIVMFWKIKDNVLSLSLVLFCKLQIFADMFLRNLYTPVWKCLSINFILFHHFRPKNSRRSTCQLNFQGKNSRAVQKDSQNLLSPDLQYINYSTYNIYYLCA